MNPEARDEEANPRISQVTPAPGKAFLKHRAGTGQLPPITLKEDKHHLPKDAEESSLNHQMQHGAPIDQHRGHLADGTSSHGPSGYHVDQSVNNSLLQEAAPIRVEAMPPMNQRGQSSFGPNQISSEKDDIFNYLNTKNKKEDNKSDREPIIQMENIQKTYLLGIEGVTAVRGVDLTVRRGDFLCILGTSGGGKSTLLNCMGTIDQPSRGNLKLFNTFMRQSTSDSEFAQMRLDKIGFVFQSFNLIGTMTALENVEMPMLLKQALTRSEIKKRAQELLKTVGLEERMNHYPNMLSGGEQQRVTIARALSNHPELLLMDEPTGDLDTKNRDIVLNILIKLNRDKQITMVMVTHDEYMKQYANRVIHIIDGKINREERVNPEVNKKAIRDLEAEIKKIESGLGDVKRGAEVAGDIRTQVRKITDYDFVQFQKRKAEMRMRQSQLSGSN